jgi:hypothetical protein
MAFGNEPLVHIHMSSEAPLDLHAILFVPSTRERGPFGPREPGLRLYSRKIMIQERTTDLLPEYLRFVEGVVDSEDLPLNVSRESVQSNAFMPSCAPTWCAACWASWRRSRRICPRYLTFWREFGGFLRKASPHAGGSGALMSCCASDFGGGARTGPRWPTTWADEGRPDGHQLPFRRGPASITTARTSTPSASRARKCCTDREIDSFHDGLPRTFEDHDSRTSPTPGGRTQSRVRADAGSRSLTTCSPHPKRFKRCAREQVGAVRERAI